MMKCVNYVHATAKVVTDKTWDYVTYYSGLGKEVNKEVSTNEEKDCDKLSNYTDIVKIDKYTDENKNKRILPPSGWYETLSVWYSKPTYITDNIYLGSAFNAAMYDQLKELKISLIINVTHEIRNYYEDEFEYKRYDLYDNNQHTIKTYLDQALNDLLEYKDKPGNVLIHCHMGASRSATLVIYYLMKTKKHDDGRDYTFDDAVDFLKSKRSIINPTFRFTKDLAQSVMTDIKNNN